VTAPNRKPRASAAETQKNVAIVRGLRADGWTFQRIAEALGWASGGVPQQLLVNAERRTTSGKT